MDLALVVMAAGLGSRFGGNKQLVEVGPTGEVFFDFAIADAAGAGATHVVLIVRREFDARCASTSRLATATRSDLQHRLPGRVRPAARQAVGHRARSARGRRGRTRAVHRRQRRRLLRREVLRTPCRSRCRPHRPIRRLLDRIRASATHCRSKAPSRVVCCEVDGDRLTQPRRDARHRTCRRRTHRQH